jgi:lysozyme
MRIFLYWLTLTAVATCASACLKKSGPAAADVDAPIALTDDASRTELAIRAIAEDPEYSVLPAPPRRDFLFPDHADEAGIYGIDVSHHNEDGKTPIDWPKIANQKVVFAYIKATQGRRFFDNRFNGSWAAIGALQSQGHKIYRGAYHFLSAQDDPDKQVQNFLRAIGTLGPSDLPPCLDVEWDLAKQPDGTKRDKWDDFSEQQIVEKISAWIEKVEAATGKKPILYTAASWWNKHIPTSRKFVERQIWVADYGAWALQRQTPRVPNNHNWVLWQFTDTGKPVQGGLSGRVDANVFKGKLTDFQRAFGLPEG